ncbi:RluA family pseudouridine synthase [Algicella marina]|uniref:Pseudouridine synthase n=1 Tax=Algicella marina TaxID=2683284 RepID=A0A6P1SVN8_9RHOB|nr:RluA family pseudouridine synthase [Algicella marina]QHQ33827.1 RluA family pseudouridine synthase [Algicella marina]
MTRVQTLKVDDDGIDQRLDRWLRKRFPHVGQGMIERACRKGEIRVDGKRVKTSARLEEGQMVRVPPLPDAAVQAEAKARRPNVSDSDAKMIRGAVIFKDDHIIALNKPPGLAVQGGSGQTRHVDGLSAALAFELDSPPKLVHRLDKDTSGLLILARTGRAAAGLAKAFQSRETKKIYWAVVAGVPRPSEGTVQTGLVKAPGHGPHGAGEKMVSVHPSEIGDVPGAKRATSDYKLISAAARRAAWVALSPITGRTHQLRVHMAEIGTPIVGDGKYGTNSQTNEGDGWGAQLGGDISRKLHLHARTLILKHPVTGKILTLTAALPEHMARTWTFFGWQESEAATNPFEEDAY